MTTKGLTKANAGAKLAGIATNFMTSQHNFTVHGKTVKVIVPDRFDFISVSVSCFCKRGSHKWHIVHVKPEAGFELTNEIS